jgi:shikimate kinase
MAKCEKILLAGFSGAGKTTFLKELEFGAPETDWEYADLDRLILKSRGKGLKTLAEIIERDGWEKFRLYERQELEGWLKEEGKGVLALGGGTLSPLLYDLYKGSRKVGICYLHAPFEDCWERLHFAESEPRPLVLKGKAELMKIYQERQMIFGQIPWRIENPKGTDLPSIVKTFWERVFLP